MREDRWLILCRLIFGDILYGKWSLPRRFRSAHFLRYGTGFLCWWCLFKCADDVMPDCYWKGRGDRHPFRLLSSPEWSSPGRYHWTERDYTFMAVTCGGDYVSHRGDTLYRSLSKQENFDCISSAFVVPRTTLVVSSRVKTVLLYDYALLLLRFGEDWLRERRWRPCRGVGAMKESFDPSPRRLRSFY